MGRLCLARLGEKHKDWLAANFRVEVGGLPCKRVSKVESFTLKQRVLRTNSGTRRVSASVPTKVEIPNLKLTISKRDIKPWQQWHKDFVINGKCARGKEMSGAITFLDPSMKKALSRLDLSKVCVRSIRPQHSGSKRPPSRMVVEISCEEMKLNRSAIAGTRRR